MKLFNKLVYLFALFPIVSTLLYLLVMASSVTEDFSFTAVAIIGFVLITAAWAFIGALFARTRHLLVPSAIVAHIIPIATTLVYTVLYIIAQINESAELEDLAVLIGGLGTGFFGVLGSLLYALIPLTLFEVYINFMFSVLVFIIGYAVGAAYAPGKKKPVFRIK